MSSYGKKRGRESPSSENHGYRKSYSDGKEIGRRANYHRHEGLLAAVATKVLEAVKKRSRDRHSILRTIKR